MLKIYTLSNCDTCRGATKWLRDRGVVFEERPIRDTPPSPAELRVALAASGNQLRKLFNTSGRDYREQKLGDKLPAMNVAAVIALLAGNGNLVKRPFLIGDGVALVGFQPETWDAAIAKR